VNRRRHPNRIATHTRRLALLGALAACGLFAAPAAQALAATGPLWNLVSQARPSAFQPGDGAGNDSYVVTFENIGGTVSSGEVTVLDHLPPGITTTSPLPQGNPGGSLGGRTWTCPGVAPGQSVVTCTYGSSGIAPVTSKYNEALTAGAQQIQQLVIPVHVAAGTTGNLTNTVTISGGGAPEATVSAANPVNLGPPKFGHSFLSFQAIGEDGRPYTQAGGHPYAVVTDWGYNLEIRPGATTNASLRGEYEGAIGAEEPKTILGELPLGLIGDPMAAPRCPQSQFSASGGDNISQCPASTRVGSVAIETPGFVPGYQLYNLNPPPGHAAEFGFHLASVPIIIVGDVVRNHRGYTLRVSTLAPQANLGGVHLTFFGNPAKAFATGEAESAFLTNQVDCSAGEAARTLELHTDSWSFPGAGDPFEADFADPNWLGINAVLPPVEGCQELHFEPKIEAQPTTNVADSPSGLDFSLHVPQNEEFNALATPELKKAVVTLPPGVVVNPSAANGLGACSEAQIELGGARLPGCPEASKLGTVEVTTPLLAEKLSGQIYLAKQRENPFHSLLALYLTIENPARGVLVKLAGEVHPDPVTGQLTATFDENPQIPFEDLHLTFFGGARAPLRTPQTCGSFTTSSQLTPWSAPQSGPVAASSVNFEITSGANGGACPKSAGEVRSAPAFNAGTLSPQAGAYSPFLLKLTREDGTQELSRIDATLPPGLTGKLAGVAECSGTQIAAAEARSHEGEGALEQASPSCPATSEVGTVNVGAGAGPNPFYVQGHAYLAGPYKGAPISLAIVTPAVAGPFDLGTVVVRTALYVDPVTTQITAESDPIPAMLAGIPLDVRSIALNMSRNQFTLNPTSCERMSLTGQAVSLGGATTALSNRFQVGGCEALRFRPNLALQLKGATKRIGHPALKAVLTYPQGGGYANLARAQVNLPHGEFLDQGNLNKTCTRPVLLAGACPASTVYGKAKAWTPLLEAPLEGPVYLVGGYGYKLPALVAELNGQIKVLLVGKVDSGSNKGIRATFEAAPDAPVEKFVLEMKGGKKYGLLENSENLCKTAKAKRQAIVRFTGQNGKVEALKPVVANQCKKAKKKQAKQQKRHR
jgi:hypothetical protein